SGVLESRFEFEGRPVRVQTCCHADLDLLSVRIESPLLGSEQLLVRLAFPYAAPEMNMADWHAPARHTTTLIPASQDRVILARQLDETKYQAALQWTGVDFSRRAEHEFVLRGRKGLVLEFSCGFSPGAFPGSVRSFAETRSACESGWNSYWQDG